MEQSLEILHRDNYKVKQQLRDNTTHDYAKNDLKDTTMEQILKIFRDKIQGKSSNYNTNTTHVCQNGLETLTMKTRFIKYVQR